jgi:glyoxylase-like metal-dependent hydrolase (beta-lactamase superfamily II)
MRKILSFALLVCIPLVVCAQSPTQRVDRAVQAMGGDALTQLKTITIKAHSKFWEPHQSMQPGGEMRFACDASYTQSLDFGANAMHTDWERNYVYPGPRTYKFGETVAGGVGYVNGIDTTARTKQSLESNPPQHTMSALHFAAASRELERASPLLLVAMKKSPNKLQAVKGQPAVKYQGKTASFIVMFDKSTSLPDRIRTRDYDALEGDSNYDLVLSDWRPVGGIQYPFKQQYQLNGKTLIETTVDDVSVNPALDASLFAIPDSIRAAAPKTVAKNVPYQWVLRRPLIGTYLDSDSISYDPRASKGLALVELAPGISQVQGGSHNSLIVEMNKYLVGFDTPISEAQSKWTIAQAKKKYHGKPFKYVVLTHHHMDHTSGIRTYAASGATIVVGKGDGAFFGKVLASPDSLGVDAPKGKVKAHIVEVADHWSVSDGKREVDAYLIDNPHAANYLIGYVPDAKLGWVTDLWSPGRDQLPAKLTPPLAAVVNGVNKYKLEPERFAGGHGSVGNYADLRKVAESSQ